VILKFSSLSSLVPAVNNSPYGLGAAIFSANINSCLSLSNKLEAGTVWINNVLLDVWSQQLPFGGYKESGWSREGAEEGLKEWTQLKTVKIKITSKVLYNKILLFTIGVCY
jgi:aldehyde dehydrogenase (NAD+)